MNSNCQPIAPSAGSGLMELSGFESPKIGKKLVGWKKSYVLVLLFSSHQKYFVYLQCQNLKNNRTR